MNLDDLKIMWKDYDQKITATKQINEKLIKMMIREKSGSTLSKIRRNCLLTILLMGVLIWFCIMSIIHNAFDYEYKLQYLPLIIYTIVAVIFIFYLIKEYSHTLIDLNDKNIKDSLSKVLALHKKFKSVNLKLGLMFLFAAFLYQINASFKVYVNQGILPALYFLAGSIVVNLTIIFIAHKMGAFKDQPGEKLKESLLELEELEKLQE